MTQQPLPPDDFVLRYVNYTRLFRHPETDDVIGCLPQAFQRREDEDALSVTWIEHFSPDASNTPQVNLAVQAIRQQLNVTNKSGFALTKVETIKSICQNFNNTVRIIHEPSRNNTGHSGVRRISRDDDQLLEMLAAEACIGIILNTQVSEK